MSHVFYKILEQHCCLENDICQSYGIAAYTFAESTSSSAIVAVVNNITSDRQRLSNLVQQCNLLKLSPIHLKDVVEDFLIS